MAKAADLPALRLFIEKQWKAKHILATNDVLLDWQHLNKETGDYNFVLGLEKRTQEIHGVLGFIQPSQFDVTMQLKQLCWMAIWKTHDAARGGKLGRHLMAHLEEMMSPAFLYAIGASAMSLPLYQALGYQVGRLGHFFILNPEINVFKLATVHKSRIVPQIQIDDDKKCIAQVTADDILQISPEFFNKQKSASYKSAVYLINRYLSHPIYVYQAYKIQHALSTVGLIVTRICSHDDARAIRVVDFIGPSDALRGLGSQWLNLLREEGAEYIDFYNAGVEESDLLASGFTRRTTNDSTVIPNYFEPFSKINVEIDYMVTVPAGQTYRIVKGDSDLDRPNLLVKSPF
ncbi:MAG: hypothetical protein H7Z73_04805 [Candidatus Saccharibacteria bacterium]|nr:hypothetical protein [Moraxellaceae bacterium]